MATPVATATVGAGPRAGFRWTPELILYAIDLWHRRHLQTPTQDDWERAGADHPCRLTVLREFGTWNAAIRGTSVMCAPERIDNPTASASSWTTVAAICSGVWWSPV